MYLPHRAWPSYRAFVCAFTLALSGTVAQAAAPAADALPGTWEGNLVINPATRLDIQFIVSRNPQNKLVAVLNAPAEANLQNVAVSAVSQAGEKVVFVVDEVNGRYEGVLRNGKMSGKWKQNGAAFDLALKPFVAQKIPAPVAAQLNGPWHGVLSIPQSERKINLVLNFKADAQAGSGMSATVDSPDQSAFGIPAESVSIKDGTVQVKVLRPLMSFAGKLEGGQLVGKWTQGGAAPLTFSKGKFEAAGLVVDKATRDRLEGNWYGKFGSGIGIAFRFKENKAGNLVATMDSPHEGRNGIPVSAVTLDGDKLRIRVDGVGAAFSGTLAPDAISGRFSAGGQGNDLSMARAEYVPEAVRVPPDLAGKLVGKWEGKTANTYMILRFKLNDKGELIALQDIPNRQLFGLPVSEVTMKDGALSLKVRGIAAEFRGRVSDSQISGDWTMPSLQFPLKLNRATL